MYFDRYDICEAWWLLAHDWGLYATITRLERMPFKPSPVLSYEYLTDNGKEIYDMHDLEFIVNHNLCNKYTYSGIRIPGIVYKKE